MDQVEFRDMTPLSEITFRAIRRYFLLQFSFRRFPPGIQDTYFYQPWAS